jgi:hypothetical protein
MLNVTLRLEDGTEIQVPGSVFGAGSSLSQGNWFVSQAFGKPTNPGTAALPIDSNVTLASRWGSGNTLVGLVSGGNLVTNVTYLDGDYTLDPINFNVVLPPTSILNFFGTPSAAVLSVTVTAVQVQVHATNTDFEFTANDNSTGLPVASWTPFLGMRLRVTAGANAGQLAFVAKNIGGGAARACPPSNPTLGNSTVTSPTLGTFSIGDVIVVEPMMNMNLGAQTVASGDLPIAAFQQFFCQAASSQATTGNVEAHYKSCRFAANFGNGDITAQRVFLTTCSGDAGFVALGTLEFQVFAGLSRASSQAKSGGYMGFDFEHYIQGASLICSGGQMYTGTVGIWDSVQPALQAGSKTTQAVVSTVGADINSGPYHSGTEALYGKNNAIAGLQCSGGCYFRYKTTVPTIASTAGVDFILGETPGQVASFGWVGDVIQGPFANTWANLTAIGPAGFNGNATIPAQQCGIFQR